ncbi:MAG: protein-methionine-sulfoxide reductase catalytic subunit MsrP [Rhodospirillaceae bacterium]|nr:protein-methionine-sulfoxide reductase catalytic subunit MsrP [Rhodospirillaceae bacterium]MBT6139270.1 protein-methionine-sulfoxide reductase catalytic subunit MsrP [Rhodospirillaceae bacterium]
MLLKRKIGWELPESSATPETLYLRRRDLVKALAAGPILAAGGALAGTLLGSSGARAATEDPSSTLYPFDRNPKYTVKRAITEEEYAITYNNFYEFGSHKNIHRAAQALPIRPWTVTLDGMVEKPMQIGIDDLMKRMAPVMQERVYRHRCVEAWSMIVPWSGFPMKALVDMAKPLSSARYIHMQTFMNPEIAPGQRQHWYPWPYVEGLTVEEAMNELSFMVTGLYGKPLPAQNGSPLRLAAPWKYGFKQIKSIVRFTFSDKRPKTFWEALQASEYGFWANVNPKVSHPRWSQATEKPLGASGERVPTLLYNGYGEYVADLYKGMENEKLFM